MKVHVQNHQFTVSWQYNTTDEYECWLYSKSKVDSLKMSCAKNLIKIKAPKTSRITTCTIRYNDKVLGIGEAVCSFKDRFVKDTGRLLSLQRALKAAPNEEVRQTFLRAYEARKINKKVLV